MSGKKTTLMDIANATGFSAMTVSKALNNKKGISSKTRTQIVKVAAQMNYTPNLIARSLRVDVTATVGIVLAATNEMVSSKLLGGISAAADLHDYSLLLASVGRNADKEEKAVQLLASKRIDGLILIAPTRSGHAEIEAAKAYGIPIVLLMRRGADDEVD
ncbi:MAG: LacI family DNA-binding transcriptional regulator, partial [Oscillospiraceae bacterium]